jgi:SAM-dependent methyltransferase
MIDYNKIANIYSDKFASDSVVLSENDIQLRYIMKYIPQYVNSRILDAGCGNGKYAAYLSTVGFKNIFAIDLFDPGAIEGVVRLRSRLDSLPFCDAKFDFVYSNSVIYYVEDAQDAINEIKRILKDDGVVMFTAHTKYSLFTLWRIFKRDVVKSNSMRHLDGVEFKSALYYRKLLERNDFDVILQDGYQVSAVVIPMMTKIARALNKIFNICLSTFDGYSITRSGKIAKIKSEISYHSVFVARKKCKC